MIRIIVFLVTGIIISGCSSLEYKKCHWGDCDNGYGESEYEVIVRYSKGIPFKDHIYRGTHKNRMKHGHGKVIVGNSMSNYYDWFYEGKSIVEEIEKWRGGFRLVRDQDKMAEANDYYKSVMRVVNGDQEVQNNVAEDYSNKPPVLQKKCTRVPESIRGDWKTLYVSNDGGKTHINRYERIGRMEAGEFLVYRRGLPYPRNKRQSIIESLTYYIEERRPVVECGIYRHDGQDGVILLKLKTRSDIFQYQVYEEQGGAHLVIKYVTDSRGELVETARFIAEIK